MDCFYAAIEVRDDPSLRGRPVAVGGSPDQRGVLCTCNYEARRYGVRSAMPSAHALRLCPDLVLLPVNMEKYQQVSRKIQGIFRRYTEIVEPVSLDEAYLDVTDAPHFKGSATLIAQDIRRSIYLSLKLTASAGIAANKFLAKTASEWNKPNGQFVLTPDKVDDFLNDLSIEKIYGVGKVTAAKLHHLGIKTCGQLRGKSRTELALEFGSFGEELYNLSRGIDDRPVQPERQRKSLSVEETFNHDLKTADECLSYFSELFAQFSVRLEHIDDKTLADIKSIFVKIKFNDFTVTTIQAPLKQLDQAEFEQLFQQRFDQQNKPVRLLGIGVHFREEEDENNRQLLLSLPKI